LGQPRVPERQGTPPKRDEHSFGTGGQPGKNLHPQENRARGAYRIHLRSFEGRREAPAGGHRWERDYPDHIGWYWGIFFDDGLGYRVEWRYPDVYSAEQFWAYANSATALTLEWVADCYGRPVSEVRAAAIQASREVCVREHIYPNDTRDYLTLGVGAAAQGILAQNPDDLTNSYLTPTERNIVYQVANLDVMELSTSEGKFWYSVNDAFRRALDQYVTPPPPAPVPDVPQIHFNLDLRFRGGSIEIN
jgi:hypothetical protein